MPIRRAVNSTRETPPKSKLAEGEEEKPGKVKRWTASKGKSFCSSLECPINSLELTCSFFMLQCLGGAFRERGGTCWYVISRPCGQRKNFILSLKIFRRWKFHVLGIKKQKDGWREQEWSKSSFWAYSVMGMKTLEEWKTWAFKMDSGRLKQKLSRGLKGANGRSNHWFVTLVLVERRLARQRWEHNKSRER